MKTLRRFLLAGLCLVAVQCATFKRAEAPPATPKEQLKVQILELLDSPDTKNAFWGVAIKRLGEAELLVAFNAHKSFMPASNLKLYTTAAALALLGKDFHYETGIYCRGDITDAGVLQGDLIIQGSGDPSISGRYRKDITTKQILQQWCDAIIAKGIITIQGNIIGDDDCFSDEEVAGTWEISDFPFWYAAPSSGLSINDNCYDFTLRPADRVGEKALLEVIPVTHYFTLTNEVVTTGPKARRNIDWWRPVDRNQIRIFGQLPLEANPYEHRGSVYNGTLYTATLLKETLEQRGVIIEGKAMDIDMFGEEEKNALREACELIHLHRSPPVSELIAIVNKPSQNFYADMLLKTLGKRLGEEGSFSGGVEVVEEFLSSIDTPGIDEFRMRDGSGLSRFNLVQPRQTLRLLEYMATHPDFTVLYDSLPIAGVDGTLRGRMRNVADRAKVHAKTGFVSYCRTLSGYADDQQGNRWVFSLMCNNYTVPTARVNRIQDQICQLLVEYSD